MTMSLTAQATAQANTSIDKVWAAMTNFGNMDWSIGIADVEVEGSGVGMVRKVLLEGSTNYIHERLTELDADKKSFTYAVDGEGLPGMLTYSATAEARALSDETCELTWTSNTTTTEEHAQMCEQVLAGVCEGVVNLYAAQFA